MIVNLALGPNILQQTHLRRRATSIVSGHRLLPLTRAVPSITTMEGDVLAAGAGPEAAEAAALGG